MSMRDRRDLERFTFDCVARVTVTGADGERISETRVRDISASGAFVYMESAPKAGTRVEVEIHLVIGGLQEILQMPGNVRVRVHGRIVWSNHQGAGVLFEHPLRFSSFEVARKADGDIPTQGDATGHVESETVSDRNEEQDVMHPHHATAGEELQYGLRDKL